MTLMCLSLLLAATPCLAEETTDRGRNSEGRQSEGLGLAAPAELAASGLLQHILPRFSLKTGLRVSHRDDGQMQLAPEPPGTPVFARETTVYHLRSGDSAGETRFRDWLLSEIGRRTVESFAPADGPPFRTDLAPARAETAPQFTGDAGLGAQLALTHCGRCHVVGPQNRMAGLGSTPSFAVLRALPDWSDRFQAFFALNPHPAFTQVEGVTPPFAPERPSPIVPVQITLAELDAILAFVAATGPADLGAPLQLQ